MKPSLRRTALLLSLGGGFACTQAKAPSPTQKAAPAEHAQPLLADDLRSVVASQGTAKVIVNLRVEPRDDESLTAAIARTQDALLSRRMRGFTLGRRYKHVPALAGVASADAMTLLSEDPLVTLVQKDEMGAGELKEAVPAVGGDKVHTMLGLTGRGVRVALLDTGIDTDHPDLKDALVAQHCFTQRDCAPFGAEGESAEDDNGHGSNVAGIVASNGIVSSIGFAPDAELVAVKINDANDSGQESDWIAGLDWLYDNLSDLKVRLVNLSIGTTALYAGDAASCDRAHPAMAAAIKNLHDAGVALFAATGNSGSTTSLAAPACNSGVIAVGAVYDSDAGRQPPLSVGSTYRARWGWGFANCSDATSAFDKIACFTNSNARMDVLAPGATIVSDSLRGRTEAYWGTSQAAPAALGVAALMLECNPDLTPAQIKDALVNTGVPVMDVRNGLSFPSIRALEAVRSACATRDAGAPSGDAGPEANDAGTLTPGWPEAGPQTPPFDGGSPAVIDAGAMPGTGMGTPLGSRDSGSTVDAAVAAPAAADSGLFGQQADPSLNGPALTPDEGDDGCTLQPGLGRSHKVRLQPLFVALLTIGWRVRRKRRR